MKIDRVYPRCRGHYYCWVLHPDDNEIVLEQRPPNQVPTRVTIKCADCGHKWSGRLSRTERGFDESI